MIILTEFTNAIQSQIKVLQDSPHLIILTHQNSPSTRCLSPNLSFSRGGTSSHSVESLDPQEPKYATQDPSGDRTFTRVTSEPPYSSTYQTNHWRLTERNNTISVSPWDEKIKIMHLEWKINDLFHQKY